MTPSLNPHQHQPQPYKAGILEEKKKQEKNSELKEEIDSIKEQLYKKDIELAEKDNFIIKTILNNNDLDENAKKAILSSLLLI